MPAIRGPKSKSKTRRHTRDLDQVHADINSKKHLQQYHDTKAPEDLPGFGQWYCVECAKWFESETNLAKHGKGKPHKRRVRQLKEEPYNQKEAEAAIGLTTDNGRKDAEQENMEVELEVDEVLAALGATHEVLQHRLGDFEVADHAVLERADGADAAGRAADHLLGDQADGVAVLQDAVSSLLDRDHGRQLRILMIYAPLQCLALQIRTQVSPPPTTTKCCTHT